MTNPRIEFISPTSRAMGRMATILFRPFDMGKWLALGFSAWLATLLSGTSPSFNFKYDGLNPGEESAPDFNEAAEQVKTYLRENLDWIVPVAGAALFLILLFSVALLWLNSRGKFMFLDNTVHNRALVSAPWGRFRSEGNSLFRWRLVFSAIVLLTLLGIAGVSGFYLYPHFAEGEVTFETPLLFGMIGAGLGLLLIALIYGYITVLLEDFVIPLSYKHSLPTTEAWSLFLRIHQQRSGTFILYFLWSVMLQFMAVIIVVLSVIATCCLAGIVLAIPYFSAVLLLPVSVFFRSLGPEFLRQFGSEGDLWEGSLDGGFSTPL